LKGFPGDRGKDRNAGGPLDNPLKPPDDLATPSYGGAQAGVSYGAGLTKPSGAIRPKAQDLNGDPLGALGFNPYDPESIRNSGSRSAKRGVPAADSGALFSPLPSSLSLPVDPLQSTSRSAGAAGAANFSAPMGPALPSSVGPSTVQ
jgi:hypothetical protein